MSSNANRLKRAIEGLLADQRDDLRLRDHFEGLRHDQELPGLTWFWGPELYRRNRAVFRELILAHFATLEGGIVGLRQVKWSEHAERLEIWLGETRRNRDTWLTRRLLRWKHAKDTWRIDSQTWCRELVQAYQAAAGPAARAVVLDEFDDWFELDESTALALYAVDPGCSQFLLKHLPMKFSFWGGEKRVMWKTMIDVALKHGDEMLAFALYRRQVGLAQWESEIQRLAVAIDDPERLNDELRRRHPEGWGLKLTSGAVALARLRGRDVFPYLREKLESIVGDWFSSSSEPLLKLADENGWWDLWTAMIRTARDPKVFNRAVAGLLDNARLPHSQRIERLRALAGVSREWNWPGLGLAWVHGLDDQLAVRLYQLAPELVRGPFKPNIVPTWWLGGPLLLAAVLAAGDEALIDLLASRYATRAEYAFAWNLAATKATLKVVEDLADHFQALRDRDERRFARRAANVLTQIPAYAIHSSDQLLRTNRLARLLFARSLASFLDTPDAVRDLIEGSAIQVQMLAYRVLAQDDERARSLAADSLDILVGTLARPLHRKTRLAAFDALRNAARHDAETAAVVLRKAREALRLPDKKYPKEELVGLIGSVLVHWPGLRGPREQPVVHGWAEALT